MVINCCAKLRQLPEMADVPAVALTGYGRSNDIERALDEGFSEHLTKPLDLDALASDCAPPHRRSG